MTTVASRLVHCLSFDVEEHFQVAAFWSETRRQQWDQHESRVENNTRKLADMLSPHDIKATFFILGWVAERYPAMVKSLANQGHEIASHGYGHELVYKQSQERFREDVKRAKHVLEAITGVAVQGYRAPSFSINDQSQWALPILVEEGHTYDSSIYTRFRRSNGHGQLNRFYEIETSAGKIWEISPSTANVMGMQVPVAGGGYFRLFPYGASKIFLKRLERQGSTFVIYLHPWEIDPDQPRMKGPWVSQFRHYLNLGRTQQRLSRLLADFRFRPIKEAVKCITAIDRTESSMANATRSEAGHLNAHQANSNKAPQQALAGQNRQAKS
jgi:polysaccharide deacetylase family protein (PEP-CTERM system associated)